MRGFNLIQRRIATILLLVYLVLAVELTLLQFRRVNPGRNLVPFRTIVHDLGKGGLELAVNTCGNILATMPLGFLLPVVFGPRLGTIRRVAAASLSASLLVELAQAWSGRRVADVDDLLLNTIGGLFGYAVLVVCQRLLFRRRSGSGTRAASPGGASRTRPPAPL